MAESNVASTRRFHAGDPLRFEAYYENFKDLTFESTIIPLSLAEAKAIVACKEKSQDIKNHRAFERKPALSIDQLLNDARDLIPDSKILSKIESNIDEAIAKLNSPDGVFVKLSTRSPKDSVLTNPKLLTLLRQDLEKQTKGSSAHPQWMVNATNSFIRSACYATRVTSGAEALQLLCLSNRVLEDIKRTELVLGNKFDMKIIIRRWANFDPIYEFRGFVFAGELCSCSQYYKLSFTSHISHERELISTTILEFFNSKIKPRVPQLRDYTIDFVLSSDLKQIWVVELNNPPPTASTSLFDWNKKEDQEQMKSLPFKLRINNHPLLEDELKKQIYQPILPFLKSISPPSMRWDKEIEEEEDFYEEGWMKIAGVVAFTLGFFVLGGLFVLARERRSARDTLFGYNQ